MKPLEFQLKHYISGGIGLAILLVDFVYFFNFTTDFGPAFWYFNPLLVLGLLIAALPFFLDFLEENKRQKELEIQFLEFVRALVETVKSGVSVPKAIEQIAKTSFGALTPYTKKLAAQLEWGYPLHDALRIFAEDTANPVIKRSINIVMQAERSGGDMSAVLDAVTQSVYEVKKVREERKSRSYTQTIQGYIIFFFFIAIMLVLEIYLIPKLTEISGELGTGLSGAGLSAGLGGKGLAADLGSIFTATIIIQGFFAGLMIGKFAEGNFKFGVKHSVIMIIAGYLLMTTIKGVIG